MRRCYLAGPMRSKPQFNYPAFMEGERQLREAGWDVLNPASMDLAEGFSPEEYKTIGEQMKHAGSPEAARGYAARDTRAILSLRAEDGDAIVVLSDWQESIGATAEVALARWVRLPVLTLEEATR